MQWKSMKTISFTIVPDSPAPGLVEVTFQPSVPMVTYLAIFVVSDFLSIDGQTPVTRIPFTVLLKRTGPY